MTIKQYIKSTGISISHITRELNKDITISTPALYNKLNRPSTFKVDEVYYLKNIVAKHINFDEFVSFFMPTNLD